MFGTYLEVKRLNIRFIFALFHWYTISGCFNFKKSIDFTVPLISLFHMILVLFPMSLVSVPVNVLFPVFRSCLLAVSLVDFAFSYQEGTLVQFSFSESFEFVV